MKILSTLLALLLLLLPQAAAATTQFSETIYLDGQKHALISLPLEQYFGPHRPRPQFRAPNTATWRGYLGTWEIKEGALYLKAIRAWTQESEVGLESLFPDQKGPVAATWFTGKLVVPQGRVIKPYVPYPIYEKYLLIQVEKGRVTGQEIGDNPGEPR